MKAVSRPSRKYPDVGGKGRFLRSKNGVGRVVIQFDVANYDDMAAVRRGQLKPEKVRRARIEGVVDSGATRLVLPAKVVKRLGIEPSGKVRIRYADGRERMGDWVDGVYVEILGRHSTFPAVVEPRRQTALIGVTILETLDFLVDCQQEKLFPRHERFEIHEIE